MGKNKIIRFEENLTFDHLFQRSFEQLEDGFHLQGSWHEDYFGNDNAIILELGCGKGEYTIGLARRNPDKNYIGVDIKGSRMWVGCKQAEELELKNVADVIYRGKMIILAQGTDVQNYEYNSQPNARFDYKQ